MEIYINSSKSQKANLHLTAHHLIIQRIDNEELWLLYSLIFFMEVKFPMISIKCRHFMNLKIFFVKELDLNDFAESICSLYKSCRKYF